MAMVSATVAAGRVPTPTLVPQAGTWASAHPEPLDPATVEHLRTVMRSVVTSGTATAIAGRGEVYGKTGEAEVSGGSHAWFTGWRDDIAFATLIVHGGGSSTRCRSPAPGQPRRAGGPRARRLRRPRAGVSCSP